MPNNNFYCKMLILFSVFFTGCQSISSPSSSIAKQFSVSGSKSVNLASAVTGDWGRVCVLAPYSNDAIAAETLGFKWSAESLTSIEDNEEISLLVFVKDSSVISYVVHPRNSVDFASLGGRCFQHDKAKFLQAADLEKGWYSLFPADEVPLP